MKKCPYCAEMIQDEAIKCRYCFSDLRVPPDEAMTRPPASGASSRAPSPTTAEVVSPGASTAPSDSSATTSQGSSATQPRNAATPPSESTSQQVQSTPAPGGTPAPSAAPASSAAPAPEVVTPSVSSGPATAVRYTHSGYRYVLGFGSDFFGVWDRQSPSEPAERFPRTDEGWRQAWLRFAGLEPNHVAVPGGPEQGPAVPQMGIPADTAAEQYTHSGSRFLLGYGRDFFGIWDRQDPSRAVERFPRTDAGWADAWRRYTQIESHFSEVSLGNPSGS